VLSGSIQIGQDGGGPTRNLTQNNTSGLLHRDGKLVDSNSGGAGNLNKFGTGALVFNQRRATPTKE
jgi:hypothetical protein